MLTFFISGTYDVTIADSEVGPFLACYGRAETRRPEDGPDTTCPDDPPYYPYAATGSTAGSYMPKIGPNGAVANSKPRNITLDGVNFHDHNSANIKNGDCPSGNSFHSGCLFVISVDGFQLRNSTFRQCVVYDIQVQDFTTAGCCGQQYGPATNVTMENNWFGQPVNAVGQSGTVVENGCGTAFSCRTNAESDKQAAVQFDPRNVASAPPPHNVTYWKDILLRFNSWQAGFWWNNSQETNTTFSNVRVVGNTGDGNVNGGNCDGVAGLTYAFNAFTNRLCGQSGSVLLSSSPFV